MRRRRSRLFKIICLVVVAGSGLFLRLQFSEVAARQSSAVNFERDIRPLLHARCIECHGPEKQQAGLRLDTKAGAMKGSVIVPGKSSESELIRRVSSTDSAERMPSKGAPLTAREIALLRAWIDAGATWPETETPSSGEAKRAEKASWWSLQPLAKTEPPVTPGIPADWPSYLNASPIDRFIFAKLAERGLKPNPEADRRSLIRRVTYDLTGLPPSPEEVEAFVKDSDPKAYEKLVDRLLASPRYGEQWGRHWLDVVRFGESNGFERNVLINNLWPYRDYVIRSFNEDKPFNQFFVEQLAGDVVGKGNPDVEVGTAFLVCGPYDDVGNQDAAQAKVIRANTLDDLVAATSNTFLGLTVNCARCHFHKFDPIPTDD